MFLFEQVTKHADSLARIGEKVRAQAKATNTTVSYTEPAYGHDVIIEYPDGHRERRTSDGVVVAIPPREG